MDTVTLQEIADALGRSKQGVGKRAKREAWPHEAVNSRGGQRKCYPLATLPADVRLRLAATRPLAEAAATVDAAATPDKAALLAKFQQLPARKQEGARARFEMLRQWWSWLKTSGQPKRSGTPLFCRHYLAGELHLPDEVMKHMPRHKGALSLDYTTLSRWEKREREQGLLGLVDGHGQRKGRSIINETPGLRALIEALIVQRPHITGRKLKDYLAADHPALDVVSARSIERFVAAWKKEHQQEHSYLTDPDSWKNNYMSAFGSLSEGVERLNQLWEMDATPADWMLKDGRHSLSGVIDVYSRRPTYVVTKTPTSAAHCALLRRVMLRDGMPEMIKMDNGQDYAAKQLARVCRDLEVQQVFCPPFTPEAKPHIERMFRTLSHGLLDLLPGFIGHNVAERSVIEARKSFAERVMKSGETIEVELTAEQLQRKIDDWVEHVYQHDAHGGLAGKTPWRMASEYRGAVRRLSNPRALDMLLQDGGARTVGKKGIRIDSGHYIAPELAEWIGDEVEILRDPDDLGVVYVYGYPPEANEKVFVCAAQDPDRTGISRAEVAAMAKARQRKAMQAASKAHREASKALKGVDIATAVIDHRKAQRQNVSELPQRSAEYSNNALEQAAKAAQARDGYTPAEPDAATQAAKAALAAEMQRPARVSRLPEKPAGRYRRWLQLDARLKAGDGLDEEEHHWWKTYQASAEFKTQQSMAADFPDAYGLSEA